MTKQRDDYYRDGKQGVVYTPMEEARRIIEAAQPQPGKTIYDPCCGNGNLLIAAAQYRLDRGESPRVVAQTIYGGDINAEAVVECRERLVELLGERRRVYIEANIKICDFLHT